MNIDELIEYLEALRDDWNGHYEYTPHDYSGDWAFGVDTGYARAADELEELIEKVKRND